MNDPISIIFGIPTHGWLPVDFHYKSFHMEFAASDGLNDPIEELYNAINKLNDNYPGQVIWWLEPGAYYFDLEKRGDEISLIISETDDLHNSKAEKKIMQKIVSDKNGIIKPFIEAIKGFSCQMYEENDWPYRLSKSQVLELQTKQY